MPAIHPYARYINELARQGVVTGTQYNQFQPEGTITRAQAAVMVTGILGLEGLAPVPPFALPYLDGNQVPTWARDAFYVMGELGIMEADPSNRIRPQGVLTRAKAAVLLDRLVSYLREDLPREYQERLLDFK